MPEAAPQCVALLSQTKNVGFDELARVAAALSRQLVEHFQPVWDIAGSVHPFSKFEDVPRGYWYLIVRDDILQKDLGGYHSEKMDSIFSLVRYSEQSWTISASHECLEMLRNPKLDQFAKGPSPRSQKPVDFLVEICDPCQAGNFSYPIDGVSVSDFYTPDYFNLNTAPAARYSFGGSITEPLQVLKDGYLSWHEDGQLLQLLADDEGQKISVLGAQGDRNARARIYSGPPDVLGTRAPSGEHLRVLSDAFAKAKAASQDRASELREEIDVLLRGAR